MTNDTETHCAILDKFFYTNTKENPSISQMSKLHGI